MKKRLFSILVFLPIFLSCTFSNNKDVILEIQNSSKIKFDSIRIFVYPSYDTTIYNVDAGYKLSKIIKFKNIKYEKGTFISSVLTVFKDSVFYQREGGIIDYPYGDIDDKYEYYIFDDYIGTKKNVKPPILAEKRKISEFFKH